jgi:diguanylate cyclase (GGDEF)-like protein
MVHEKVVFRAALARGILALFSLTLLPVMYPAIAALRPVFLGYLGVVVVFQALIRKNIGGSVRTFLGGLVDLALLTFLVHRVGSTSTLLISVYLFAGMMNALVATSRTALALALTGAAAYTTLVAAECLHYLPYGLDTPAWAGRTVPSLGAGLILSLVLSSMSVGATAIVANLVRAVRKREGELEHANAQLEELSQRDPLTQLYNRRHLLARVQQELARAGRGHPFAVLMIDLDGFKRVNDESGHLRGDALLKEISAALIKSCRETDVPGRYGGDEFLIVLPDTDAQSAQPVAERIAGAVREVGLRFDARRPVTASVGVAQGGAGEEVASVLRRADQNAYVAKQSGGDRVAA